MRGALTLSSLEGWLEKWRLVEDGPALFTTQGSLIAPVVWRGRPAMLKVSAHEEDRLGAALMAWYGGLGAAKVYKSQSEALLLERVRGRRRLAAMATEGDDPEATSILCHTVNGLHTPRGSAPPPRLIPLERWFQALRQAASDGDGVFARTASIAKGLLAQPLEPAPLHGDLHHDNVLDGDLRGWLAIDPKGLWGERGFEFTALFRNPSAEIALAPGVLERRLEIVGSKSRMDLDRLVRWVAASAGLSAAWSQQSGEDPRQALALAHRALSLIPTNEALGRAKRPRTP